MHSTEPRFRRRVVWASGLFLLLSLYVLLCVADELLARWLDRQAMLINAPARAIEAQRTKQQDEPQLAQARAAGWGVMLYPALFETGEFKRLALQYGVVPLGTQPSARLAYCNEGTGLVSYTSDRFGFRNADSAWDQTSVSIVVLGDSFMQGACVADQHTVTARLATSGRSVIGLGTAGNNGLMHAAVARAFLPVMRPQHAVLVFYANDNDDEEDSVLRTLALPDQPDYLQRTASGFTPGPAYQRLKPLWAEAEAQALRHLQRAAHPAEQNTWATRLGHLAYTLSLPTVRRLLTTAYRRGHETGLAWSSRLAIDTLAEQCRLAGCTPMLVYIPNSEFWRPDPRSAAYRQALKAYANSRYPGMPWVDTTSQLAALGIQAYAPMGGHLSAAGYAAVAQAIAQKLPAAPRP